MPQHALMKEKKNERKSSYLPQVANNVDSDHMLQTAASDHDLDCLSLI